MRWHADQLALQIDQRAAGVAGIDRRVGLDEVLVESALPSERPSALMMPEVTVWLSANGLPIASTKSPTSALLESASGISIRLFAVIFSSATSEGLSRR